MDKRVVGRWQKDLDRDGFCVVDVCTPAEAAEWKLKVRELDEQRRRASGAVSYTHLTLPTIYSV